MKWVPLRSTVSTMKLPRISSVGILELSAMKPRRMMIESPPTSQESMVGLIIARARESLIVRSKLLCHHGRHLNDLSMLP